MGKAVVAAVFTVLVMFFGFGSVHATSTTYYYMGDSFTTNQYPAWGDHLTATVTIDNSSGLCTSFTASTVDSSGNPIMTLTANTPNGSNFWIWPFGVNTSGNVTSWNVMVNGTGLTGPNQYSTISIRDDSNGIQSSITGNPLTAAYNYTPYTDSSATPGQWQVNVPFSQQIPITTPLPAGLLLLAPGLVGLAGIRRRFGGLFGDVGSQCDLFCRKEAEQGHEAGSNE